MTKSLLVPCLGLLTMGALSSCATKGRAMPGMDLSQPLLVAPLARDEYEVLEPVQGTACRETFFLFPLPIGWSSGDSGNASVPFSRSPGAVGGAALYNALETAWADGAAGGGPDAVISPVWDIETKAVPPWYSKVCVSVRARAVRIK